MPRSLTRARAVTAALVLATHALFVLLLQIEGRKRPEELRRPSLVNSITIRLSPAAPQVADRPDNTNAPRRAPASTPATQVVTPTFQPQPDVDTSGSPAFDAPPPVDWVGKSSAIAARVAQDAESPPTFGPSLQVMRRPCTPRTHYDQATRELMDPLLPEIHDPIPPGGIAAPPSSVKMGGVRVGILGFGGDKDKDQQASSGSGRKSSFKWKWESPDMGNGGVEQMLTSGWAEPVEGYDGMFDDMLAGRTARSSVPDPDTCD